jgi:chorismate synthase
VLSYRSAGESHGPAIVALLEGMPAGLEVDLAAIDAELARRQAGFGRGARMRVERDRVTIRGGLVHGKTSGAPLLLEVANRDTKLAAMPPLNRPRPGHADLAGAFKYSTDDARPILERASARETCARVAAGALVAQLLDRLGVETFAAVDSLGGVDGEFDRAASFARLRRARDRSDVGCPAAAASAAMRAAIVAAARDGDSLGGTFVVLADGVPPGLGTCAQWDERIDARLAAALMSIPAIKGVEIGAGFDAARRRGSEVHDEIAWAAARAARDGRIGRVVRGSNRAGGLEGGITNGERLVVRAAMKPISTLRRPLRSIDLRTGRPSAAAFERADVCAVPAASVVGEAMVRLELGRALLAKFGGDTVRDVLASFEAWRREIGRRFRPSRPGRRPAARS